MSQTAPRRLHVYTLPLMDSARWEGFESRPDDILVCTSYKAGTTWTQMICALLIFQKTDFGRPLTTISPWLEIRTAPIEEVLATYAAQRHRRFIKTHTPLDGLPYFEDATYLYCGRDPRDVFMSMLNHLGNTNIEAIKEIQRRQGIEVTEPEEVPTDINEIFRIWLTRGQFEWESDGFPYWSHFHHAQTFWDFRQLGNVHFLHFADLQADLGGQMRRIAGILGIDVEEGLWPELVEAATFGQMKKRADELAPDVDHGIWHDAGRFFNRGQTGQWIGVLSDESLALYEEVKSDRLSASLADWLEKGSLACGEPEDLPS